jgi:ATP-dependent helicase HepA
MTRDLAARVSAARAEVARAYDPLLDLRSCDPRAVRALGERGATRIGARIPAAADAETALRSVAGMLETRLEAVTIEAAKRVGLAVDVEVDVLPGQVSFHVGPELKVDALAGFDLAEDRTVVGSFRREIAVKHEEHDSFATGHPLVEALFSWVRDGELGRATVGRAHVRGRSGAALDVRFLLALPEPADLAQGARVPSRRAARHLEEALVRVAVRLDGRGGVRVEDGLAAQLDSAKVEPVPAPEGGPPGAFVQAVEAGLGVAQEEAQRRLRRLVEGAKTGIRAEQEAAARRLLRWLSQSKVAASEADKLVSQEAQLFDQAAAALDGARLELDQVALIQLT